LSRGSPTALELLLPAGVARGTAVFGSGCPPRLAAALESSQAPDLAVLAPGERPERSSAWAEATAAAVARTLRHDGTAVVVAAPVARRRLVRELRGQGFRTIGLYLHLPSFARTIFVVPLRRSTLRYVVERLIARSSWRRSALLALTRIPRLAALSPSTGVVMCRDEAVTPFDWLGVRDGVLQLPRQWSDGTVVHGFESGPLPSVIAKVREGVATDEVRERAATAGIRVPRVLRHVALGDASAKVEEALHGLPAASALAAKGEERALALLADLERLLTRWNSATLGPPLHTERLERETVDRARALQQVLDPQGTYADYLRTLCRADIAGRTVAAHNDLTTWNILVDGKGGLALLDWDEADVAGLPLVDFAYAAVDAVTVAGAVDRLAGYRLCFEAGSIGRRVRGALERLAGGAQLTPAAAELCLHACWLRHASNEHARREQPTPFLEIVREVAARGVPTAVA
jgi:Phosphotransferase enzyme family